MWIAKVAFSVPPETLVHRLQYHAFYRWVSKEHPGATGASHESVLCWESTKRKYISPKTHMHTPSSKCSIELFNRSQFLHRSAETEHTHITIITMLSYSKANEFLNKVWMKELNMLPLETHLWPVGSLFKDSFSAPVLFCFISSHEAHYIRPLEGTRAFIINKAAATFLWLVFFFPIQKCTLISRQANYQSWKI